MGHSQGTLMPEYYVKFLGGAKYVAKYIGISPLWEGTGGEGAALLASVGAAFGGNPSDYTPFCQSCAQMGTGSAFLAKLHETPLAVKGVAYTNIVTQYDDVVYPYTSGFAAGMTNLTIQDYCSTDYSDHLSDVADPTAADLVLNALDPKHPRTVRCEYVTPAYGVLTDTTWLSLLP